MSKLYKRLVTKKCLVCETAFQTLVIDKRYCSARCKKTMHNRRYYQTHAQEVIQRVLDNRKAK